MDSTSEYSAMESLVRMGDFTKFQDYVQQLKAGSLNQHVSELLHVASASQNQQICVFLLDEGADVNHLQQQSSPQKNTSNNNNYARNEAPLSYLDDILLAKASRPSLRTRSTRHRTTDRDPSQEPSTDQSTSTVDLLQLFVQRGISGEIQSQALLLATRLVSYKIILCSRNNNHHLNEAMKLLY